jgi:hypothetical protein
MLTGVAGLALGTACLVLFLAYGDPTGPDPFSNTTIFALGLGCGFFLPQALRAFYGSRNRSRRSAHDALGRARRYRDSP